MQITSATWKQLWAAGAPLEARATIAGTDYTQISAPVIHRAAMQERLSVGNVAAASLTLSVRGAAAIPRSAAVAIEARLNDGTIASEWLPLGTFYVSRRARDPVTGVVALECYDALLKANAVWEPSRGSWPRTMAAVAAEMLALLDLELDSRTAIPSGAAFVMSEPAAGTTIRDALGTIAQAGGGNWIVTPAGKLRLVPIVDASNAEGAESDVMDVEGVTGAMDAGAAGTITGVRCTADGTVTLTGDDSGIVVDVSVAPMIAVEAADLLIGRRYQAYRLTGAICDPAAELGDYVRAGANGEIASALYSQQISLTPACRSEIAAPQAGELTDEYPHIGSDAKALALAKAYAAQAVDALDSDLTQQEIFNRLTDNGAAQGLVLYNGQLYVNASYINAGFLNANRIQGGTLTLGGSNNINGLLQVLDANGNVITTLNNNGANIANGSITAYSTDQQTRTVLSDGNLKFQYYRSDSQPIGWFDGLSLTANSSGATIDTFLSQLNIRGRGAVYVTNKSGTADDNYAYLDLNNGIAQLSAISDYTWYTSVDVQSNGVTVTIYAGIDPPFTFKIVNGQSSNPLSIGNGGTGASTAANARANLGITPANIGAVAKSDLKWHTVPTSMNSRDYADVWCVLSGQNVTNLPTTDSYYAVCALGDFQIAVMYGGEVSNVYVRYNANSTWSAWKPIANYYYDNSNEHIIGKYGNATLYRRILTHGTYSDNAEVNLGTINGTPVRVDGIYVQNDGARVAANHYFDSSSYSSLWIGNNSGVYGKGHPGGTSMTAIVEYYR